MEYEHFGFLLQELRKKYSMSRDKLAQNICTPKQIYRIEKGISEPSVYILHQLSIKFNLDLNEYYKMHFTKASISGLMGIDSINAALISGDTNLLKSITKNMKTIKILRKAKIFSTYIMVKQYALLCWIIITICPWNSVIKVY